jgi:hypothetical protein
VSGETSRPPPATLAGLTDRAAIAESAVGRATQVAKGAAERDDDDRSWIGRRIITVFIMAIAGVLFLFFIQGTRNNDWPTAAAGAADLIKTAVVPIVTLVLGYYFGKSGTAP